MSQGFSLSKKEIEIQRKRHINMMSKIRKIKLAIFDVDGVLTDGKVYYGAKGETLKVFNIKDGSAFVKMQEKKIKIAVISGRDSKALRTRMRELKVKYCYYGSNNKVNDYERLKSKLKLTNEQILYVGDDAVDVKVMEMVGIALAPADAHLLAQRAADAILSVDGGQGVAQLICDMFLMAENYNEQSSSASFEDLAFKDRFKHNIH